MVQNREYIKYKIFFNIGKKKIEDIQAFIDTIGVEVKTSTIEEDLGQYKVEIVSLYAWKLMVLDRSFGYDATMILVERL